MKTPAVKALFVVTAAVVLAAGAENVTESGLIAYWPFVDGLADAIGGNPLVAADSVSTAEGYARFVKTADNANGWARTTKELVVSPYGAVTYSLWLRNVQVDGRGKPNGKKIFEISDGNVYPGANILYNSEIPLGFTATFNIANAKYAQRYSSEMSLSDDSWHMLTIVLKTGTAHPENIVMYIDGVPNSIVDPKYSADSTTSPFVDGILYIGRRAAEKGTSPGFVGDMDDIRVYGVDKNADIVRLMYYAGLSSVYANDEELYRDRLPDGVRSRDGAASVRMKVSSELSISCNGRPAQTGVADYWVAGGEDCTLELTNPEPGVRVMWLGIPSDAVFSSDLRRVTFVPIAPLNVTAMAFQPTHVWTGAKSEDFADAENWTNGTFDAAVDAPNGPDASVYIPSGAPHQPTASSAISVGEFRIGSASGPSDIATFTSATAEPHVITGSVYVLQGGVLTHLKLPDAASTSAEACYKLVLDVGSDMNISSCGRVDANLRGYATGKGPGADPEGIRRASYGGCGRVACYGSVFRPLDCGSGGTTKGAAENGRGGGAVKLTVNGTLTVDGTVCAKGCETAYNYVGGSGGSVWIDCGTFAGRGAISAAAAVDAPTDGSGGGRVAIYVRQADAFVGSVDAYGGRSIHYDLADSGDGGAGTVYWQKPGQADGGGTITIDNKCMFQPTRKQLQTEIPMSADGNARRGYRNAALVIMNKSKVKITQTMSVRDLNLATDDAVLDVGTNTLTVLSLAHNKGKNWASGATVISNTVDGVTGKVVWKSGMLLMIK